MFDVWYSISFVVCSVEKNAVNICMHIVKLERRVRVCCFKLFFRGFKVQTRRDRFKEKRQKEKENSNAGH